MNSAIDVRIVTHIIGVLHTFSMQSSLYLLLASILIAFPEMSIPEVLAYLPPTPSIAAHARTMPGYGHGFDQSTRSTAVLPDTGTGIAMTPVSSDTKGTGSASAAISSFSNTRGIGNATTATTTPSHPVRVRIPTIALDAHIERVGLNEKGEMEVPDGRTNTVGWYQYGTMPGMIGSAVFDAHVYAAFSKLKYVTVGSDIYVTASNGAVTHFVVDEVVVYPLNALSPELLFKRADAARLNLITCAGVFVPALDTYDHRLVVYAKLVR